MQELSTLPFAENRLSATTHGLVVEYVTVPFGRRQRLETSSCRNNGGGTMFCTKCGALNPDDANYCSKCGAVVSPLPNIAGAAAGPVAEAAAISAASPAPSRTPAREADASTRGLPCEGSKFDIRKIPAVGFTAAGRRKTADRLKATHEKQGWRFLRFEEDAGKAYAYFEAPMVPKKKGGSGWWLLATACVVAWLGLSAVFPVLFIVLNSLLGGVAGYLIFAGTHRRLVFKNTAQGVAIAALVGCAMLACLALLLSWAGIQEQRRSEEEARNAKEQADATFAAQLAVIEQAEAMVETEPVNAHLVGKNAHAVFSGQLKGAAAYGDLGAAAAALMEKTKEPFADRVLGEAKALAAKRDFLAAEVKANEAAALVPELDGLKEFRERLGPEVARERAQRAYGKGAAAAKEQLAAAAKLVLARSYVDADVQLRRVAGMIDRIPAEQTTYLDVGATRKKTDRLLKQIAPMVKKERARVEREKREAATLEAKCGRSPARSGWDGEVVGTESYVARTAHDPDSIDVENCTTPTLTKRHCWLTTCDVRGKNAFGAMVLTRMRFSIAHSVVLGSEAL